MKDYAEVGGIVVVIFSIWLLCKSRERVCGLPEGVSWRFGVADSRVLTGIGNGRALAAGF